MPSRRRLPKGVGECDISCTSCGPLPAFVQGNKGQAQPTYHATSPQRNATPSLCTAITARTRSYMALLALCSCPSRAPALCVQVPGTLATKQTATTCGVTETRSKGSAPVRDQARLGAMAAQAAGRLAGPPAAASATTGRGRGGGSRRRIRSLSGCMQVGVATSLHRNVFCVAIADGT